MYLKTILNNLLDKITENFTIKIISLVIAMLLWFYIKSLTTTNYEFYLPINYNGIAPNKVIVNQTSLPNYVLVRIKGNKEKVSKLLEIPKNSMYAVVDLTKTNQDNIYKVNLIIPEEMKKLQIQMYPNEVFVDIDEIVETNLPVVVRNSDKFVTIPDIVKVKTISRNLEKLSSVEIDVDPTKISDKIVLENTPFLVFYPQIITVSNTNLR